MKQKPKLSIRLLDSELAKREGGKVEDYIGNVREVRKNVMAIIADGRVKGTRYRTIEILQILISGAQKIAQKSASQKKKARKKK